MKSGRAREMVTPYLEDKNKVWTFQRGRTVHSSFLNA